MAREIPTFTTDRTTQIPSMGIVQQSGTRAIAEGLQARGQVFDQLGEYANRKADEFMERNQRLAAERAVREGGLDPAELSSPITTADRIYREAALNTYAIQVEDDIDTNLSRLYSENQYNPAGFRAKAQAYLQGTVSELAPELKNGVSKFALADIRKKSFSLEQELQAKIRQEAQQVESVKLAKYRAQIINADSPEEKKQAINKMMALIEGSPFLLTEDAESAAKLEAAQKIERVSALNDVMNGEDDIEETVARFENVGIAITPAVQQEIYNAYNVKRNHAMQKENEASADLQKQVENTKMQMWEALGEAETEQEAMQIIEQSSEMIMQIGDAEEAMKIKPAMYKAWSGQVVETPQTKAIIDAMIDRGMGEEAIQLIKEKKFNNQITPKTEVELMNRIILEQAAPLQNDIIKSALKQIEVQYAPMANFAATEAEMQLLGDNERAQIAEDKRFIATMKNRIVELSADKSLDEVANLIKQTAAQTRELRTSFEGMPITQQPFTTILGLETLEGTPLEKYSAVFNDEPWSPKNYKPRIQALKDKLSLEVQSLTKEDAGQKALEIYKLQSKFGVLWDE